MSQANISTITYQSEQSPEEEFGLTYSEVPLFLVDPIETNISYIARIALQDKHAKELLRHGGIIDPSAGLMHSCPKLATRCYWPTLAIRYGKIPFSIEVDEVAGNIVRADATVPDQPNPDKWRIRNKSTGVVSVYINTTLIMTYNASSFIYLKDLGGINPPS